jgi:hypothetical protein
MVWQLGVGQPQLVDARAVGEREVARVAAVSWARTL